MECCIRETMPQSAILPMEAIPVHGVKKRSKMMRLASNQENEKKANAPTKEIALMLLLAIN
jgi:hypothetical protein